MSIDSIEVRSSSDGLTITYVVPARYRKDTAKAIAEFTDTLPKGAIIGKLSGEPKVEDNKVHISLKYASRAAASNIQLDRGQVETTIIIFFGIPENIGFHQVPLPASDIVNDFSRGCG